MSSPENPVEAAGNVAHTNAGGTALVVPATPPEPDGPEPAASDLPSLHQAEIATARRYADASRAASTQRDCVARS